MEGCSDDASPESPEPMVVATSVENPICTSNHHLAGAGEFSAGTLRNFQPDLTPKAFHLIWAYESLQTTDFVCSPGPMSRACEEGGRA